MKRMVAAILVLTMLMASCPAFADSFSDMLEKAEAYQLADDNDKAMACYQLAQQISPDREEGFLGEAGLLIEQSDYAGAAALADKVLELNPVSPAAWALKCRLDVLNNDIAAFEKDSVFAAVCEADLSADYGSIATMYANAGMHEKAAAYSQAAGLPSLDERDEELDARFDADQLTLVKATTPEIRVEDFEFPSALWQAYGMEEPEDPQATVAASWAGIDFTWLSFSPSGNSGILLPEGDAPVAYYNGKFHVLYPSSTRGVADENKNLERYAGTRIQSLIGAEGIVYSPDGRYAGIYNIKTTLERAQYFVDPIIIDLSTGEMILTATYKNKPRDENMGVVATATFSADGKYLYYVLYGHPLHAQYLTALYRYNLESCETEFCYSGSDFTYYPGLAETQTGSFLILRDARNNEMAGLVSMEYKDAEWSSYEYTFDLPVRFWNCNRLLSSIRSGYALVPGRVNGYYYAFQCIKPDEAFRGLNQYMVVMKDSNALRLLDAQELGAVFEEIMEKSGTGGLNQATLDFFLPFHTILNINLSPDGHYALLLTINSGASEEAVSTRHLFLVRLDDMAMKEVKGVDPSDILVGPPGANYQPTIEWNTDTLLINTRDGIQAYQFQ